ncbi:MAG TPA: integrin alpha [Planctomycetota bacterium]|nr:integrin alpha [Planctomycetota bacterium]
MIGSLALATGARAQGVIHTFNGGGSAGLGLGHCVRPAGDVDGDGVGDVIAGFRTGSNAAGTGSGSVRVWSGASGAPLWTFVGAGAQEQFGRSVAAAGDVNGDGYGDLIVGAAGADTAGQDAGCARVYSGADGSLLYSIDGPFARARFGTSVAGLGDIDGDGRSDFAVSGQPDGNTPQPAGFVRVYSGADGSLIREHVGSGSISRLGCAIAAAGDVDGDGVNDLIAGDWRDPTGGNNAGAVRVFSGAGGAELFVVHGQQPNGRLGSSVDGAGDVDGDGRADVIAGAPYEAGKGAAHVWSGADAALLWSFAGDSSNDLFGIAVAGLGDVDGDGLDDVGVGASADDDGGSQAGSARVYAGADGAELWRFDGNSAFDELGFSLARVGDVDGDGGADFAIGAPGDDAGGGPTSGVVRVHAGVAPPLSGPQSYCTTSPNSAGDGALMGWSGSAGVAATDLVLNVSDAPPHTPGMFFFGAEQAALPFDQGTLCIAPPLRRLHPVLLTSRGGEASYALWQARSWSTAAFVPGTTWNFQFLYLDKQTDKQRRSCGRAFNLSDGLSVTFTP